MPTTLPIAVGPIPRPMQAPPAIVCERDEGVGAEADVEQRPLGALDEDPLAALERLVDVRDAVDDVRQDARQQRERLRDHVLFARRGLQLGEQRRAEEQTLADLFGEPLALAQVAEGDAQPRGLVGIGRADPAPRRAERVGAHGDEALEEPLFFAIEKSEESDLVVRDLGVNVQRGLGAQRGQCRERGDGDGDVVADARGFDDGLAGLFEDELAAQVSDHWVLL